MPTPSPSGGGEPPRTGLRDELSELVRADLAVNPFLADRAVLLVWRLGQVAHGRPGLLAFALRRLHTLLDVVVVRTYAGAELPRSTSAGPGLRLPHSGRGVVLHPSSRLGRDVVLYHRVTLGVRGGSAAPVVEDGVYLGCGAAVLGDVRVGSGASVGANAVVLADVPSGDRAVGVPARLLGRKPA
ncbi:serine acetyltransferase [Pseudokineococcus sp. 1T1Z-3]|uniref:serine acetyltransferase n=1 Tax=Pseudokineococcus sp. 1T1Z-3 TaxID=3132745 RepID=UPI0030A68C98